MKTAATRKKDSKLLGYFRKPQVCFTHLDDWYCQDITGYLIFLTTFRTGLKELLEGMLLTNGDKIEGVNQFLLTHSSALTILELHQVKELVETITMSDYEVRIEELKSELFYQLYFIIESVNYQIYVKKRSLIIALD
jgi:hypothetical protein